MKVLLGMLARSDPAKEPLLDTVLSIVAPSFDDVEILYDGGQPIADFGAARNRLVDIGERRGFDWIFMLDSDECMFPEDIAKVRALMTPENRLIVLPRYEFVRDLDHYDPSGFPDYQRRVFRLGVGYRYRRSVHEGIYRRFSPLSETRLKRGVVSDDTPIYHYGRVRGTADMILKFYNYDRIKNGEPLVDRLPDDVDVEHGEYVWGKITPFEGPHPLKGHAVPTW